MSEIQRVTVKEEDEEEENQEVSTVVDSGNKVVFCRKPVPCFSSVTVVVVLY